MEREDCTKFDFLCEKRLNQTDKLLYQYFRNSVFALECLLSDYKKDRWLRRKAILQLHENLNTAIRMGILCLYYKNNSYAPAEDRQ
ncbi:MAG: hypothetical protein MJ078_07045 [Clostridia bacterium]|nr:hypothetical protein [Clostridia bacterium]